METRKPLCFSGGERPFLDQCLFGFRNSHWKLRRVETCEQLYIDQKLKKRQPSWQPLEDIIRMNIGISRAETQLQALTHIFFARGQHWQIFQFSLSLLGRWSVSSCFRSFASSWSRFWSPNVPEPWPWLSAWLWWAVRGANWKCSRRWRFESCKRPWRQGLLKQPRNSTCSTNWFGICFCKQNRGDSWFCALKSM